MSACRIQRNFFDGDRNPLHYPLGSMIRIWGETLPSVRGKLESPVNTGGKAFAGRCRSEQNLFSSGLCKSFKCASTPPTSAIKSSPAILQRVANPIQPFGFTFVQDSLMLSLLDGIRDSFGNQADLLDQLEKSQANEF
jgi:hypothetical protein